MCNATLRWCKTQLVLGIFLTAYGRAVRTLNCGEWRHLRIGRLGLRGIDPVRRRAWCSSESSDATNTI